MPTRALPTASLAVVLVVAAGCAGIPAPPAADHGSTTPIASPSDRPASTATATPSDRPTPSPTDAASAGDRVTVSGEPLATNATVVFRRVQDLLGTDVAPPDVIVVSENATVPDGQATELFRAYGATATTDRIAECGAVAGGTGDATTVRLRVGGLDPEEIELLLVHEYVHAIQKRRIGSLAVDEFRQGSVAGAVQEGAAVYVTDRYAREYGLDWSGKRPIELRECFYDRSGDGLRGVSGAYYFGARHFEKRIDEPRNVWTVFEDPPRTSEELLHGLAGGAEPPADLAVAAETGGEWRVQRRYPGGELRLRAMLTSALTEPDAAEAAAGWGNDTVLQFRDGNATGAAWVLRFDDPAEAEEFATLFGTYEATVEGERNASVRLVRVAAETVVVLGGAASFVSGTTATGTDASVTVRAPAATDSDGNVTAAVPAATDSDGNVTAAVPAARAPKPA
jgi:hypothetical protein